MLALASLAVVGLGFAAGTRLSAGPFALREDTGIEESQRLIGLVQRGVFAEAAAAFPPSLDELDTDAARAAYATALAALGRGSEARRQYELVVARHPWNALAWYNLGNLFWEDARDAARAEAAFRRALAEDPRLADARFNLGVMLLQQRRYAEAVRTLEEALAQAPEGSAWREEAVRALGLAMERAPR
jgi:tetratricopeptide (TPR) repeat protein